MSKTYFGTDGIRGRANSAPMTAATALRVAMAAALVLRKAQPENRATTNRVIIGKDTRLSGYMFEEAMCAGFVSMGMNAVLVGPIPTPGIARLTRALRADLGVMISASHNLFEDNGIKLFGPDGYKLNDEIEAEIEVAIDSILESQLAPPDQIGKAKRLDDAPGRYIEFVKHSFPRGQTLGGLKVVVDCANGAAYKIAPQALWELEAEVIEIGVAPNGRNINAGCGATDTAALQKAVVEHDADIGLALDGDADRLIVVDEQGRKIDGDQIMAALTLALQSRGELKNNALVATVMSNLGLERFLAERGIDLIRTAVGDRAVVEAMRAGDYNIGGEQSGHLILSDHSTTGDGLLAGLQVLSLLKEQNRKASEVLNLFTPLPQILKNVRFAEGTPLEDERVQEAIQTATKELDGCGRVLVRASGTEPLIRVMAEGDDHHTIEQTVDHLCSVIESVAA